MSNWTKAERERLASRWRGTDPHRLQGACPHCDDNEDAIDERWPDTVLAPGPGDGWFDGPPPPSAPPTGGVVVTCRCGQPHDVKGAPGCGRRGRVEIPTGTGDA